MISSDLMHRVRTLLGKRGITQAAFARAIEVSPQTLSGWLMGRNRPGIEEVARMCGALRVSPSWLLTGCEDNLEHQSPTCADCVAIPLLDLSVACGNGQESARVAPISLIQVSKSWIASNCADADPRDLKILSVTGDSMSPTLEEGDFVTIDTAVSSVYTDGIYAFSLHDNLFIKRIQRVGRGLLVISDNERYKDFDLSPADLEQGFKVHGRVLTRCLVRRV